MPWSRSLTRLSCSSSSTYRQTAASEEIWCRARDLGLFDALKGDPSSGSSIRGYRLKRKVPLLYIAFERVRAYSSSKSMSFILEHMHADREVDF
jgi:hypothetical protein